LGHEQYTNTQPLDGHYQSLVGKTVAITGAARGMGRLFATELARRGVNAVISDVDPAVITAAEEINRELSAVADAGRVVGLTADVTVPDDHDTMVRAAIDEFGGLHGWVNNAGIFPQDHVLDISPEQMTKAQQINVNGTLYGAQAAARHFRDNGGGAIVNMASVSSLRIRKTRAAYNAAKAAALQLTYSLAVELGDDNIRVNAITPGFIDTAMTQWVHEQPGALDHALSNVPLHRIGAPLEVFAAVYFLLSDSARYITGAFIAVDGGSRHV
jgi:3-oxoacyl-[acyl-carrier protein] reductase